MLVIGCGTKPADPSTDNAVDSIVHEGQQAEETSHKETGELLDIYNDILNALVKKHFYQRYLGTDFENIGKEFGYNRDKPEYKNEVEKLRTAVESDTSKQSTICIGSEFSFIKLSQLSIENFNDSIDNPGDLRSIFKNISTDYDAVYDSLTTPQKLSPDYLQSSSFRIGNRQCDIGMISFSKIFFNKQRDKGLLYNEFVCDEKCGKGEFLWIENNAGLWTITKNERLWIL